MAKKIKQRTKGPTTTTARPQTPLSAVFRDVAGPMLDRIGVDPVPATMSWAMGAVAAAWNASRNPLESAGLEELDQSIPKLLTPAFPDAEDLAAVLEEVFHLARVRHPRDPRVAVKVFVERRGPGDFHVEVVGGIPTRRPPTGR